MDVHTAARGRLLSIACALLAATLLAAPANAQIAAGKSKYLGSITGNSVPANFSTYWNQVTPENATKWGSVEGTRNTMNWGAADAAYNWAQQNGYPFKFHTLVWGAQFPGWLTSTGLTQAQQRAEIEQWIMLAGQRFPNAFSVDVVNEPIKTPLPWSAALGGAGSTGWDWVITAFTLARQRDPLFDLGALLRLRESRVRQPVRELRAPHQRVELERVAVLLRPVVGRVRRGPVHRVARAFDRTPLGGVLRRHLVPVRGEVGRHAVAGDAAEVFRFAGGDLGAGRCGEQCRREECAGNRNESAASGRSNVHVSPSFRK